MSPGWSRAPAFPIRGRWSAPPGAFPNSKGGESYRVHLAIAALTSKAEVADAARAIQALAASPPVISQNADGALIRYGQACP